MRATVLTEEHRTYNPIERARLIREHPHEDEDIMFFDERLCGILQVSVMLLGLYSWYGWYVMCGIY